MSSADGGAAVHAVLQNQTSAGVCLHCDARAMYLQPSQALSAAKAAVHARLQAR